MRVIAIVVAVALAAAGNNGKGKKSPMGWRSWVRVLFDSSSGAVPRVLRSHISVPSLDFRTSTQATSTRKK